MNTSRNECLEISGNNAEVLKKVKENGACRRFYIKRKVSNKLLYFILQRTNVEEIIISRKLCNALPKKSIEAMRIAGVNVKITDVKRGRRKKYDIEKMKSLLNSGKSVSKIASEEKIPERTLYYYKKCVKFL
ncbi:MAG: hypothetical protein ACP5H8_02650 [Candidatus Micrarchaeia archaeon]